MPPNAHDQKLAFYLEQVLDMAADPKTKPVILKDRFIECFKLHLKSHENTTEYPIELAWARRQLDALRAKDMQSVAAKDRIFLVTNLIRHRTKDVWFVPEVWVRRRTPRLR